MKKIDYPIDFVVTWVDSTDPVWQAEYSKYRGGDALKMQQGSEAGTSFATGLGQ